ncbi:hypothetical protein AKJ63_01285 [candidate division MSBL1 archaeon SCGC-AAA259D18]|uniref:Uncharacterized protein n=1 Tax=candidate division MSBL1 archaeon SCGC-AAA259D18 TaxID=1698262 RepID=A0A133UBL2_9EURY|nr:hypothetical protein AKJ63_01285 [candidate division MSBL1 archaeon SCGC-AAA259D18]
MQPTDRKKFQIIVVMALTILVVTTVFLVYRNQSNNKSSAYPKVFPVENAVFVYKVDSLSKLMGKRVGNITYEVTEVSENTYTIKKTVSENLDIFFDNGIKTLRNDVSFMWSQVIENGKIVENRIIERKIDSERIGMVLLHYKYQGKFENGAENIDLWKLKSINVPIFVQRSIPGGRTTAELVETNYEYLKF